MMEEEKLKIDADADGVWLSVLSDSVSLMAVRSFLCAKGIRKYDEKIIEEIVREKIHTPQKIARRVEKDEKDANIVVRIAKDGMTAYATMEAPFFTKPRAGKKEIEEALARNHVVFGIDEEAVQKLAESELFDDPVPIARGEAPLNGEDGRLELLADPDRAPEIDQDVQRVDYRMRSTVVNVRQGQIIAVRHPPGKGKNGTSVTGTAIRSLAGKDVSFPAGSGLEISEDGLSLVAAIDGCLQREDGKLSVLPELEIKGDVDFSVGNIDFAGNVKIYGTVREDFHVVAEGNVEVKDVVEGALIESSGDVVITGGIRGMGKARIVAGGDVVAGFADQAQIRSQGDVNIRGALFHSDVMAQNSVVVMGGQKSQIAGGRIQAGREIACHILGSEMGTKTEIVVGVPPEQTERRRELLAIVAQNEVNLQKLEANLGFLKKQEAAGNLDEGKRVLMLSATKAKFQLQSTLMSLRDELGKIEADLELRKSQGVVRVREMCYPGVSIVIRGSAYAVREPVRFAAFVNENGEVQLRSFDF